MVMIETEGIRSVVPQRWWQGPWRNIDMIEQATLVWVDGFNNPASASRSGTCRRPSTKRPTIEVKQGQAMVAWVKQFGLGISRGS